MKRWCKLPAPLSQTPPSPTPNNKKSGEPLETRPINSFLLSKEWADCSSVYGSMYSASKAVRSRISGSQKPGPKLFSTLHPPGLVISLSGAFFGVRKQNSESCAIVLMMPQPLRDELVPDLSISIVTHNSQNHLETLFASLEAQKGVRWELFLRDNASTDHTTDHRAVRFCLMGSSPLRRSSRWAAPSRRLCFTRGIQGTQKPPSRSADWAKLTEWVSAHVARPPERRATMTVFAPGLRNV